MDGPHMVAMGVESMICYWRELLELLPPWLREPVDGGGLDKQVREIRLHLGQPPLLAADGEEYFPSCRRVGTEDLSYAVNTASRFSAYAAWSIAQGYLTARGGHRLGLCGTAIVREGKMTGMKELRSVCIRVARDFPGLAAGLPDRLGTGSALILGPPGAGKTTLLRILLGLEKPDSGELMGTAVRWSAVFQEDRLLEGLDALGNLRFALGTDYKEAKAAAMLAALGLTWETGKPVREWSGGMKRRLALARALLAVSDAVALDEPFTGLDEENRRRAVLCVTAAAETKPVILVTHDRTELNLLRANIVNL